MHRGTEKLCEYKTVEQSLPRYDGIEGLRANSVRIDGLCKLDDGYVRPFEKWWSRCENGAPWLAE